MVPALLLATLLTGMAGAARADVVYVDLGGANIYSLGDFTSANNEVRGSIVAAGNVTANGFTVNAGNTDAYGGYAVVAGGVLNYTGGTINNGSYYAGGGTVFNSTTGLGSATASNTLPLSFASTGAALTTLSSSLSTLAATGSALSQWGGLTFTGAASGVTVIDVSAADLDSVSYLKTDSLAAGSTIILNVSGTSVSAAKLSAFSNFNIIYNFYEATSLYISNTSLTGTVLAPLATVTGSGASVAGQVVAGNWNASVTLLNGSAFVATDIAGYSVVPVSTVPEAATWQALLAGLLLIGGALVVRRPGRLAPSAVRASTRPACAAGYARPGRRD
jgi:choice-of-anchor A domain-containing protein